VRGQGISSPQLPSKRPRQNGLIHLLGAVHWLVVGVIMAMIPMMRVGIKSGAAPAPNEAG